MTPKEFKQLLYYLRCHPTEAKELATLLGGGGSELTKNIIHPGNDLSNIQACQWISAKQAAAEIGRSSSWIRRRLNLFPSTRKDKNGSYMFLRHELMLNYENYVKATTTAMC